MSITVTVVLALLLGVLVSRLHLLLPGLFPAPADVPYLDALTTIASFMATWLMVLRRTECWCYWIAVDVIGIGLYAYKDLLALSLLYAIFLCLASWGLWLWLKAGRDRSAASRSPAPSPSC
jgi:nicotinamide mononucleotide transporter